MCQENVSVSQPPRVGPKVGAMVAISPISTDTLALRAPGNITQAVAKTVGIIAPPRKPCSARKAIIASSVVAQAQSIEQMVKPIALATNRMRVESSRDSQPDSGIMTISAIR